MLPKTLRLTSRQRIKTFKTVSSPLFLIKIGKNETGDKRFRIIISKKIDKRATTRNKIKRTITGVIENEVEKIKDGYDFIFIAKSPISFSSSEVVKKTVIESLVREGFLK